MIKPSEEIKANRKYHWFEEIFPGEFIEENIIIKPDGNLSVGFYVDGPDPESVSEDEIIAMEENLEKVLSRLPRGLVVHFQLQVFVTEQDKQALYETQNGFLVGTMIRHLMDRPRINSRLCLYLCFNTRGTKPRTPMSTLWSAFNLWKNPLQNLERDKKTVKSLVQTFMTQFSNVPYLKLRQMQDSDLEHELIRYRTLDFGNTHPEEIQVDHTNLTNKYLVGDKYVGFVYMAKSANQVYATTLNERGVHTFMGWPLAGALDFPHVVNLAFRIGGEEELKELDRKRNIRNSFGKNTKEIDVLVMEDITTFTQEMRGESKVPVLMSHNVMVWDTHPDQLSYNMDLVKSAYIKMNGSVGMADSYNAGNYFNSFAPGYGLELFNTLIISLEYAILHFDYCKPVLADQKGTLLCNRNLEPVLIDLWSNELVNKNKLCIGPSGSGKSFTWNTLLSQAIEAGEEIVILDVGGSYRNLFSLYEDSKYIETNREDALTFNPFLLNTDREGNYILTEDKMNFLLALFSILWKKPGESLSKEEESIISEWLTLYYKQVNQYKRERPRLDRFVSFIETISKSPSFTTDVRQKYFDAESFSLVLQKFCTDGTYGKTLNSEDNINISEYSLICFDLFGVQSDPILYPVVSLIIIELVLDKMRKNPRTRKQMVIDEAWSMLSGSMGNFIEGLFRTLRKYNAGVSIISQGIVELKNSPVGEAIKANAATLILLDHNSQPALIPDVQRFFGLTNHEVELFKSIRKTDTWRELFIKRGNVSQVFAIDVGQHATAAFSSLSTDKAKIAELAKKGGPEYAINQFVEDLNL